MAQPAALLENLAAIVGAEFLLTDDESRTFYSTDVYRQADELAVAVAQPGTVDELQALVRVCVEHQAPMVVRGGGASYTDGFLPIRPNTVLFDTSRLTAYKESSSRKDGGVNVCRQLPPGRGTAECGDPWLRGGSQRRRDGFSCHSSSNHWPCR